MELVLYAEFIIMYERVLMAYLEVLRLPLLVGHEGGEHRRVSICTTPDEVTTLLRSCQVHNGSDQAQRSGSELVPDILRGLSVGTQRKSDSSEGGHQVHPTDLCEEFPNAVEECKRPYSEMSRTMY
jgi:hypothetical protein